MQHPAITNNSASTKCAHLSGDAKLQMETNWARWFLKVSCAKKRKKKSPDRGIDLVLPLVKIIELARLSHLTGLHRVSVSQSN